MTILSATGRRPDKSSSKPMGRPRKNFDLAVALYSAGRSVAFVAARFGVTRQSMWKILKRRGVVFRSQQRSGKDNPFFRHGRGYSAAQKVAVVKVSKAVKRGKLKPQPCEECGRNDRCKDGRRYVHAHHEDYSKPLDVHWLCKRCHDKLHKVAA